MRVAGFATALAEIVAPAAAALRATHPRLALDIDEQEAPRLLPRARARRRRHRALDGLAPGAAAPTIRASTGAPLRADTLDAVLPAGHPLAARERIALAELAGEPFVGPPDGTSCHDVTVTGCAAAGFAPAFEHWSLDFHTTMALVAAGLGVALVPGSRRPPSRPARSIRPLGRPPRRATSSPPPAPAPSAARRSPPCSTRCAVAA